MEPLPASTEPVPTATAPAPRGLSLRARLGGIAGLAGLTVAGLVLGVGSSLPLVAGLAGTFLGAMGAARLLAGGEERFENRALRWLARRTRDTWVNWGTGVYGLGALTHFTYLHSRWLFALGRDPRDLLDRSLGDWIAWSISEAFEALFHALQSLFWPVELINLLGVPWTVAVVTAGWVSWKLAWQGVEPPADHGAEGDQEADEDPPALPGRDAGTSASPRPGAGGGGLTGPG